MVRMAVDRCDKPYHGKLAYYIENMGSVDCLTGNAFLRMPGANMLHSNWSEFDHRSIGRGPESGHDIKALHFPAGSVCAGSQIGMPSPGNAPKKTLGMPINVVHRA
jgi:hypothetical protein